MNGGAEAQGWVNKGAVRWSKWFVSLPSITQSIYQNYWIISKIPSEPLNPFWVLWTKMDRHGRTHWINSNKMPANISKPCLSLKGAIEFATLWLSAFLGGHWQGDFANLESPGQREPWWWRFYLCLRIDLVNSGRYWIAFLWKATFFNLNKNKKPANKLCSSSNTELSVLVTAFR